MQDAPAATSRRTRRLTRLGILGGLAFALFGFSQSPAQAALLDANCPGPPNDGTTLEADERFAQTFTALHTGTVVRADVALNKGASDAPFTLQILDTNASGVPVNGVLGSATVPGASVPAGDTTLSGTFSSPASVVAGHLYALVVTRPAEWDITDRNGNPCPGEEISSPDQTSPFEPPMGPIQYDFVYSVFVNPPNQFTVGKQKGNKLRLTLPGAGSLTVADGSAAKAGLANAAAKKKSLKSSSVTVAGAGTVTVKLKLTKRAKQRLRSKGKLSARAAITFTPTGGEPNAQTKKLKFKQKK
jgi:hypothetical protein